MHEYIRDIGVTPITKRMLQSRKYQKKKLETITRMHKVGLFVRSKLNLVYQISQSEKPKYLLQKVAF